MPAATLVVLNPRSRGGATGRRWASIEPRVREAFARAGLGEVEVEATRGPRDGERIAREGVRAGVLRIVVAGGDGTISEVVTGVLAADLAERVAIGLLPLGRGCDLARSLDVPRDLEAAIARLASGEERRFDAGRVSYRGLDGVPRESFFVNEASVGISGLVVRLVNRPGPIARRLGGRAMFALGTLRAIARYRSASATIRVDDTIVHKGPLCFAVCANGRYFGGGMKVAPDASPEDGLLDVIVVGDISKLGLFRAFPSIYRGTHLSHPALAHRRGRRVEIESDADEVWLEGDGESFGTPPITLELLPAALRVFGLSAAAPLGADE